MATVPADIATIANLLKRERFHRDTAQWDLCRAAFHPNASMTYINVAWFVLSKFFFDWGGFFFFSFFQSSS